MLKKDLLAHLGVGFVLLLIVSVLNLDLKYSLVLLWCGTFLGLFLPYLDQIIYCYFQAPQELTSQRVVRAFDQKQISYGLNLLFSSEEERSRLVFHSAFTQVVLFIFAFFVMSSSASLLGKGLVVGVMLHTLIDQGLRLLAKESIDSWFWQFKIVPSFKSQQWYFYFLSFLFLLLIIIGL